MVAKNVLPDVICALKKNIIIQERYKVKAEKTYKAVYCKKVCANEEWPRKFEYVRNYIIYM